MIAVCSVSVGDDARKVRSLFSLFLLWLAIESCTGSETAASGNATTDTTLYKSPTSSSGTTPRAPNPNACAYQCFLGSQGQLCLDQKPLLQQCYQESFYNNPELGPIYCVLFRFRCTQESTCFLGTGPFKPGEKWVDNVKFCDEMARVAGGPGYRTGSCSAEDVKRGTVKWVAFSTTPRGLPYYNLEGQKIQSENCSSDAELCVCSSELCNAPSKLEQSDSPQNNCAYALKDYPLPSTPAPPVTINNYITVIVLVIQFKAPYQMSELTPDLRTKIATAVANVIGVNASTVSLTFVEVDLRRQAQQKGVLVSVGLKDFQGPTAPFASRLTQDAINAQMDQLGLRSVTLVQVIANSTQPGATPPSVRPASPAVQMVPCGATAACAVLAASLLTAARMA